MNLNFFLLFFKRVINIEFRISETNKRRQKSSHKDGAEGLGEDRVRLRKYLIVIEKNLVLFNVTHSSICDELIINLHADYPQPSALLFPLGTDQQGIQAQIRCDDSFLLPLFFVSGGI